MLESMVEGVKLANEGGKLQYQDLPPELAILLSKPGQRLSALALRQLILTLCHWRSMRDEELATLLAKDLKYLRNKHLADMVQTGQLNLLYPEPPNHPHQAYLTSGQYEDAEA